MRPLLLRWQTSSTKQKKNVTQNVQGLLKHAASQATIRKPYPKNLDPASRSLTKHSNRSNGSKTVTHPSPSRFHRLASVEYTRERCGAWGKRAS
jgi:hypothetical protein